MCHLAREMRGDLISSMIPEPAGCGRKPSLSSSGHQQDIEALSTSSSISHVTQIQALNIMDQDQRDNTDCPNSLGIVEETSQGDESSQIPRSLIPAQGQTLADIDTTTRLGPTDYMLPLGTRGHELIEEAAKHGQSSTAQTSPQPPPRLPKGRWQSTLVTLTVEGTAGPAWHYFNSDLWRYGGRASVQRNPTWNEVDSIDLDVRHEHIQVTLSLHEAQTRLSTSWSWSSDHNGVFCVQPEHFHVVEMVCGYLNLATGRMTDDDVWELFALSDDCSVSQYLNDSLSDSFVSFHQGDSESDSLEELHLPETLGFEDVVEALTRVRGLPEPLPRINVAEQNHKDNCLAILGSETGVLERALVRLPSVWAACRGNPCICGDSVMVLDTTKDEPEVRELAPGEQYLALSYVWAQHDESSLLSYVRRAIEEIGVCSVWIDRLCINQRCDQHKARQIPRMREVYQDGYATVVLVPDITETLPELFHTPTTIVDFGRLMSAAAPFKAQIRRCAWRTRCWTWQEGLLGKRGYYVTQEQVLPARTATDFLNNPVFPGGRPVSIGTRTGLMKSLGVRSLRCNVETWRQKVVIGELLDTEDHELLEYWLMPQTKSLGEALTVTRFRTALLPEDEVYSVLGMVSRGKDFQVAYGESRNAILRRAVNAGLLGTEILWTRSISKCDGESWAAEDDLSQHIGRVYGSSLEQGIRGSAQIDDSGFKAQFHLLEGVAGVYAEDMEDLTLVLEMTNSEKDIRCYINRYGLGEEKLSALASRVDQVLLLEGISKFTTGLEALLVIGTGQKVVRVASGALCTEPRMELETQVAWRVIG